MQAEQQRNLHSLIAEYHDKGWAHEGLTILQPYLGNPEAKKLDYLLRHHRLSPVTNAELMQRFKIDKLIEFYNLCFIGMLAGYLPPQLSKELTPELEAVLNHPVVADYYTRRYPFLMPQVVAKYFKDTDSHAALLSAPGSIGQDALPANGAGVFYNFLMLNQNIQADKDVEVFTNLIDYVSYGDFRLGSLFDILCDCQRIAALLNDQERSTVESRALWGFFKYTEFLCELKGLLDKAAGNPYLQSALWMYHGYYLERMNTVLTFFKTAFDQIREAVVGNANKLFSTMESNELTLTKEEQIEYALNVLKRTQKNIELALQPAYQRPLKLFLLGVE